MDFESGEIQNFELVKIYIVFFMRSYSTEWNLPRDVNLSSFCHPFFLFVVYSISIYICVELFNKWTFEGKMNGISESICQCGIYLCELRGKRTKRFISNLSSDTKFSFEEIVGKIRVDRDGRIGYILTDDWFFFYLRATLSKYPKSMLSSVSYVIRPEAMKCICRLRPMDQKGQIYCYRLNIPGSKVGTSREEQRNLKVQRIRNINFFKRCSSSVRCLKFMKIKKKKGIFNLWDLVSLSFHLFMFEIELI